MYDQEKFIPELSSYLRSQAGLRLYKCNLKDLKKEQSLLYIDDKSIKLQILY